MENYTLKRLRELLHQCRYGSNQYVGLFDILAIERLAQLARKMELDQSGELGEYDIFEIERLAQKLGLGEE
jgi:hypothetical protein